MFDLLKLACDKAAQAGCQFADARFLSIQKQRVVSRDHALSSCSDSEDRGFGVRVLCRGAWGFASSPTYTAAEIEKVVALALRIARASALAPRADGVKWAPEPALKLEYKSACRQDPFAVALEDKADLLIAANEVMLRNSAVMRAQGFLSFKRVQRWYANTEGAEMHSDVTSSESAIWAIAVGNGDFQERNWKAPATTQGFESYRKAEFLEQAERVADEAEQKLTAKLAPEGYFDIVTDSENLSLTIHESVGHATELDRVMGYEVSMAGSSFVSRDKMGEFRYGSDQVTLVADNTLENGLATQGFDDDGVPGQRWEIVRDGIFQTYSTGREFAHYIGEERSRGSCRADHWSSIPIVRIPNLFLMPGKAPLSPDELIADVRHGLYFEGMDSFSIDQWRLNFQFGGNAVWEIKNGRKAGMLKAALYQSRTPTFWNACDATCDASHWQAHGVTNCGKGDPMQIAQMTHGAAPTRFRNIRICRGRDS
ncbi:MAG: TldD/PmbA family protein [Gammaproteobacteria bacterium]|nr:TldD/PmbA family protein [Gammaproteobacteria bacterium]MDH3449750.1 TldD/PmbA family protein [Gammaproteobacteria bacterium]